MSINYVYGLNYDSNIYVIDGKIPSLIDTGTGLNHNYVISEISKIIDIKNIKQIILTHEHFDHTGGLKKIKDYIGKKIEIIAHKKAAAKIEEGKSEFASMLGTEFEKFFIDKKLKDNDIIKIGNDNWNIFNTPGHTPGCICLYEKNSKSLISGDTIFSNGSFGRYDFPGGDLNQLISSIEKMSKLDVQNLYPGHENIIERNANDHIKKSLINVKMYR